jgi:hypothetical protein
MLDLSLMARMLKRLSLARSSMFPCAAERTRYTWSPLLTLVTVAPAILTLYYPCEDEPHRRLGVLAACLGGAQASVHALEQFTVNSAREAVRDGI